ncbi:hypothetical protein [Streptomyces sp. NRRL B-1347]|uniref:hypothetical protein n=1 Tax=Streptomyces sp. NRRL B-1347 TaxID=1476877 RepID=UPI000A505B14|nr:hypothetical protein [Streptomyces sp. NRRL B-1347]
MDQQQEVRQAYLATVKDLNTGTVHMTCPRSCGRYMEGTKDGPLVRWSCECGYRIHS